MHLSLCLLFFFFNDTATTEIYTLSLHDALPIWPRGRRSCRTTRRTSARARRAAVSRGSTDRKSTRLNSSHLVISYAVFCLKKKKGKYNGIHDLTLEECGGRRSGRRLRLRLISQH